MCFFIKSLLLVGQSFVFRIDCFKIFLSLFKRLHSNIRWSIFWSLFPQGQVGAFIILKWWIRMYVWLDGWMCGCMYVSDTTHINDLDDVSTTTDYYLLEQCTQLRAQIIWLRGTDVRNTYQCILWLVVWNIRSFKLKKKNCGLEGVHSAIWKRQLIVLIVAFC